MQLYIFRDKLDTFFFFPEKCHSSAPLEAKVDFLMLYRGDFYPGLEAAIHEDWQEPDFMKTWALAPELKG